VNQETNTTDNGNIIDEGKRPGKIRRALAIGTGLAALGGLGVAANGTGESSESVKPKATTTTEAATPTTEAPATTTTEATTTTTVPETPTTQSPEMILPAPQAPTLPEAPAPTPEIMEPTKEAKQWAADDAQFLASEIMSFYNNAPEDVIKVSTPTEDGTYTTVSMARRAPLTEGLNGAFGDYQISARFHNVNGQMDQNQVAEVTISTGVHKSEETPDSSASRYMVYNFNLKQRTPDGEWDYGAGLGEELGTFQAAHQGTDMQDPGFENIRAGMLNQAFETLRAFQSGEPVAFISQIQLSTK